MSGPNRRDRRLKQATDLASITGFGSTNPVEGDLLIFDFSDGQYKNGRALTGNYSLGGTLTATDLLVTADATISTDLSVGGDATVTGALAVTGSTALNGLATVGGTLGVTGVVTLSDALSIAGALTGSGFTFTGSGQIDTNLTVTGSITAGSLILTTLNLTGNLDVDGTLNVDGISVFGDDISINGNLSAGDIAGTSVSVTGAASVDSLNFGALGQLTQDGTDVTLHNVTTSGHQLFTGIQSDGSTVSTMLLLAPDDIAELYHLNVGTAKTATAATGGFFVNNADTGGGYERVLTTSDLVSVSDGTVEDSILHWNNSTNNWDEMPEVTMNWVAGVFTIQVLDDGATLRTVATYDADAESTMYHDGGLILSTHTAGAEVRPLTGTNVNIRGADSTGNILGAIQFNNSTFGLTVQSLVDSNLITLGGADAGSAFTVVAQGDPDGAFSAYFDGTVAIASTSQGAQFTPVGSNACVLELTANTGVVTAINFEEVTSAKAQLAWLAASNQFRIRVTDATDSIIFTNNASGNTLAEFIDAGANLLYFNGILEASTKSGGFLIDDELEINGALNHDGSTVGLYGTTPAAQSAAYSRAATIVESRALLASASATIVNNNNVLAALIADLQSRGFIG